MSEPTRWFALVDGAADPAIEPMAKACRDHACLFSGDLAPELSAASPWLVAIDPKEPLLHAWQDRGRGNNWGLLIEAVLTLPDLRKLLRRFLQAKLPSGELVMFRFYDPRVFRTYLPSASAPQAADWFAGVRQYAVEGEGDVQHSFRWRGGRLFDGETAIGGGSG